LYRTKTEGGLKRDMFKRDLRRKKKVVQRPVNKAANREKSRKSVRGTGLQRD